MVTNTAGTTTETSTAKENGECEKDSSVADEYSNLKQHSNDSSSKTGQIEKVGLHQQNDATNVMSNSQNDNNDGTNYNSVSSQPSSNGIPGNGSYNSRSYGNGISTPTTETVNGPSQTVSNPSFMGYDNYNNPRFPAKPGLRPMQGNQNYPPSMQQRYPANQGSGPTPTLNQLLTTPLRYPAPGQLSNYNNHPSAQQQPSYTHGHPQSWQNKPPQYARGPSEQQPKPDMSGYSPAQPQQYSSPQNPGYPPNQGRYQTPPSSTQSTYNSNQQYNSPMPPPGSSGYPSATPPPPRHSYAGYSGYNHMPTTQYYGQQPPQQQGVYPAANVPQPPNTEGKPPYGSQEQQSNVGPSDTMHHPPKDNMMSPSRRTPQPISNVASVQSPLNAAPSPHVHPAHPSLVQLRGTSPAPGSPASGGQAKATPLSPPSGQPGTSLQQPSVRSISEHSDHSSLQGHSPMPGAGYGNYRPQSQVSYQSQPPNYSQHMMPPQNQPMYPPTNQQHPTAPQHQVPSSIRPSGPQSVGKPAHPLHNAASQNYSQSQQSPAYQQPGGYTHYFDNMQQQHLMMQGYSSSSPAPSERRPSRQGSYPPPAPQTPEVGRQGAAAAAAAAMAAAAHSAQPGNIPSQRPQTPNYYPQQSMQQQVRPQHPNYSNVQSNTDAYSQNMGYPRMPHPGVPTSGGQRMMAPPGMTNPPNQGMHRMHPPSVPYGPGYQQPPGPPQQGHYPDYYPSAPSDPSHPQGQRPNYPSGYVEAPPHPVEETVKKSSARSASQKLAALFEPADEPGRRDFIERILRYWEEKELPLKNAPLMGRKTLDLFRLYQIVKEKGGMQEVTSGKKWPDISTQMGLGTTTTSGFTLKKQYCKYLYGFECKVERGEPEPQEALARVTEANRKRKQAADSAKDDAKSNATPSSVPMMHSQHSSSMGSSQSFPAQQYSSSHYQHPMGQQYRPSIHPQNYISHPGSTINSGYPSQPMHSGSGRRSSGVPAPYYPNVQDNNVMYGPKSQGTSTPSSGYPPQPSSVQSSSILPKPVHSREASLSNDATAANIPDRSLAGTAPQAQSTSEADTKQSLRPPIPVSSSLAVANPFGEYKPGTAPPATPPNNSHSGIPHQSYAARPQHDPYRASYPPRPGLPPSHYPYTNSPLPHARPPPPAQPHLGMIHNSNPAPSASPRIPLAYSPNTSLTPRPPHHRTSEYPMQSSSYTGSVNNHYSGMKRSASDVSGPPSKYIRPEGSQSVTSSQGSFPPHSSYRADQDAMVRQRYSSAPGQATPRLHHYGQGYTHFSRRSIGTPSYIRQESSSKPRWGSMLQRTGSPLSMPPMPSHTIAAIRSRRPLPMTRSPYPHVRDKTIFPLDSVEATVPRLTKFQRKTCYDVGVIEGWRLVMGLKSGLLVESTWALNALTILLYDQMSVGQLKLTQLPGLLDALVEHYRRCLSEFFSLPSERSSLGISPTGDEVIDESVNADVFVKEDVAVLTKPKLRSKKGKKGCNALSKLGSKFTPHPIKIEHRTDPFLTDNSDQWDCSNSVNLADDLSHIVLNFSQEKLANDRMIKDESSREEGDAVMVVEATLEDVLSIPCSVLSPDDYDITKSSTEEIDVKEDKVDQGEIIEVKDKNLEEVVASESSGDENKTSSSEESSKTRNSSKSSETNDSSKTSSVSGDDIRQSPTTENDTKIQETCDVSSSNNPTSEKNTEVTAVVNGDTEMPEGPKSDHDNDREISKTKNSSTPEITTLCNGLQADLIKKESDTHSSEIQHAVSAGNGEKVGKTEENTAVKLKLDVKEEVKSVEKDGAGKLDDVEAEIQLVNEMSVTSKVSKVLEERNVILLEDEATGSDGSLCDPLSGPLLCSKFSSRRNELSNRLQCISNILRGLSFIPTNPGELCKQRQLMRALSGTLLLRHKHRTRTRHNRSSSVLTSDDPTCVNENKPVGIEDNKDVEERYSINDNCRLPLNNICPKFNRANGSKCLSEADPISRKNVFSEIFAPKDDKTILRPSFRRKKCLLSSTVLDGEDNDDIYTDPWWWDCVRRLREDSMVILANVSPSIDLSVLPDDHVPLAVLEACLHWSVCPSSDACDPFQPKSRYALSAQRLALEILTKLSIKDQNVDLILATRPFSRIEKLFSHLVHLICDRKDQTLREFAVVLLSNLSQGDPTAARAIALQTGSIAGLIAFLEECEETALSNRQMFRQQAINCGTTVFIMAKAARTLVSLATIPENKPSFVKHQLRLLSLSMSQLLGQHITSIIASVLYELPRGGCT